MADMDMVSEFGLWKINLMSAVAGALNNEVGETVKEKLIESVQNRVYAAYTPHVYVRRGASGGLADIGNYHHSVYADKNEAVLTISNDTTGEPQRSIFITNVIETGKGYDWNCYVKPRPFMDEGLQDGIDHGDIENALAAALARRGYVVGGFGLARG
jgi:hypothetical protein